MKKVNHQQMAERLWIFCKKFSKEFYNSFTKDLKKIDMEINQKQQINFSREIVKMNLWIISKALTADKKILDELHKIYIFGHANLAETGEDKIDFPKQAEKELNETYQKYYETWDDNSGGNQSILALTILEQLLNNGKPDKKLVNIMLFSLINMHVLTTLKAVLDFRNNFEIK